MDLSASAVEQKTFDTIKRDGFNPEQVSTFLAEVAEELAHMRGELAKERSRSRTLELSLEEARTSAQRDTDAFLAVSDAKQRVMENAERRVLALLASAHAEAGHDNVEELAREDLASILEEAEAGPSVLPNDEPVVALDSREATLPAGGIFGPGMGDAGEGAERALAGAHVLLAEASRVPSIQQTEANADVAALLDEAERVRLHAKLIHARAEVRAKEIVADAEREASRMEVRAAEHAAEIQTQAEAEKADVVAAGETAAATLVAEATELMGEARSLPERFSSEAEALVADARQQAESIRASAWQEAEQAQEAADAALQEALREAEEVRQQTAEAVDGAEAHVAHVLSQAVIEANEMGAVAREQLEATEADLARMGETVDQGDSSAEQEASSIVAAAERRMEELLGEIAQLEEERNRVAGLNAEESGKQAAEARAKALGDVDAAEAEISELLATAQADAATIRTAASDEGAGILEEARAEARRLVDEAKVDAEAELLGLRSDHQDLVARLRSMKLIIEELQQRLPDLARGDGSDADVVVLLDDAGAAAIELRHRLDGIDDGWDGDMAPMRASRYSKRSAGLPSLGREEAGRALDGIASVRVVDQHATGRKRGGRNGGHHADVAEDDEETA